jgi:hypothetical protein
MENQQKFTFSVKGIRGTNIMQDKLEEITIQIMASGLRQAQDNIRDYFMKSYLQVDSITLLKIEF